MSRRQKPKTEAAAPEAALSATPIPAAPPQPEPTGVESAPAPVSAATAAEAAPAPVDTIPEGDTAKPAPTASMLIVKGPSRGRWRAGRHFGPVEVAIPVAELSEAQIGLLEGDPELTVTWSDIEF